MTVQSRRETGAIPMLDQDANPPLLPAKTDKLVAREGNPGQALSLCATASLSAHVLLPRPEDKLSTRAGASVRLRSLGAMVCIASVTALSMPPSARAEPSASMKRPVAIRAIDRFAAYIAEASRWFDVPAHGIRAVMHVASVGDVRARSPKGAMGLMQFMPETYATLRARCALGANPYDPYDNILAGAAYLREMHDRYWTPGSPPTIRDPIDTRSICARVDRCLWRRSITSRCWRQLLTVDRPTTERLSSPTSALGCERCCSRHKLAANRPTIGRHSPCSRNVNRPSVRQSICRASCRSRTIFSCVARRSFSRNEPNRTLSKLVGFRRIFVGETGGARMHQPRMAR